MSTRGGPLPFQEPFSILRESRLVSSNFCLLAPSDLFQLGLPTTFQPSVLSTWISISDTNFDEIYVKCVKKTVELKIIVC